MSSSINGQHGICPFSVDGEILQESQRIPIRKATRQLEDEGVEKFYKPFDKLMETLAQRSPRHLTRES
jgi:hypothetical protein